MAIVESQVTKLNSCRSLEEGDIVNVDISIYLNGCHGKVSNRCFGSLLCDQQMLLIGLHFLVFVFLCSLDLKFNLHFHLFFKA